MFINSQKRAKKGGQVGTDLLYSVCVKGIDNIIMDKPSGLISHGNEHYDILRLHGYLSIIKIIMNNQNIY